MNFMMDEGEAGVRNPDGKNYDRLTQIEKPVRRGEPVSRQSEHQAGE